MKSPGLKLPLFSWEEKIGCHQEGSDCCHQTPENPAKQDLILQSWLVLLRSEGKAPQSKDYRVIPHCIKKPTAQKLRSFCPLPAPPSPPPGSPRWLPGLPPSSPSREPGGKGTLSCKWAHQEIHFVSKFLPPALPHQALNAEEDEWPKSNRIKHLVQNPPTGPLYLEARFSIHTKTTQTSRLGEKCTHTFSMCCRHQSNILPAMLLQFSIGMVSVPPVLTPTLTACLLVWVWYFNHVRKADMPIVVITPNVTCCWIMDG